MCNDYNLQTCFALTQYFASFISVCICLFINICVVREMLFILVNISYFTTKTKLLHFMWIL